MAGGAVSLGAGLPARALAQPPRRLRLANLHTNEVLETAYWEAGAYVADSLRSVNHILRDFRTDEVHVIAPALLDLLVAVSDWVGAPPNFEVFSGYRSPATNAALHAESTQVAAKSLHLEGKAIDMRLVGVDLDHLRDVALSLSVGGVGYYPQSGFVHMDVGAPRTWTGA